MAKMKLISFCVLIGVAFGQHPIASSQYNVEEARAAEFIAKAEQELWDNAVIATEIEWAYESNITDHNEKIKLKQQVRVI